MSSSFRCRLLIITCIAFCVGAEISHDEFPAAREKRSGKDAVVVLKTIYLHSPVSQAWMANSVRQRVNKLGGGGAFVRGFNMRGFFAAEIIVRNGDYLLFFLFQFSDYMAPLLGRMIVQPSIEIRHRKEITRVWMSTIDAFMLDPGDKHLKMTLSFGALHGYPDNNDMMCIMTRDARLDIQLLNVVGVLPPKLEPIVAGPATPAPQDKPKKKKKSRRRRRRRVQAAPASERTTRSTASVTVPAPSLAYQSQVGTSCGPSAITLTATTRELPTAEVYSVQMLAASARLDQLAFVTPAELQQPRRTSSAEMAVREQSNSNLAQLGARDDDTCQDVKSIDESSPRTKKLVPAATSTRKKDGPGGGG
ncbi:unnamed protein product, partial [Mesorhabditis spiculigera]